MGDIQSGPSGPITGRKSQVTVDLPSVAAATVAIVTVPVPGAELGDVVLLTPPPGGLSVAVGVLPGYVAAAGSARVPVVNPTAGALDAASAVFEVTLLRF